VDDAGPSVQVKYGAIDAPKERKPDVSRDDTAALFQGDVMQDVGEPIFLTVEECAALIRRSSHQVYRMVKAKKIPFIRIDREILFDREEVIRCLRAQTRAAETPSQSRFRSVQSQLRNGSLTTRSNTPPAQRLQEGAA